MLVWVLLLISIVGIMGATFLFPLVMACCYQLLELFRKQDVSSKEPKQIAILIPAHNEEAVIGETLNAIKKAIASVPNNIEFKICVGADHCSDATAEIAKQAGVDLLELNGEVSGKWNALRSLFDRYKEFDWVIFVDSGALWPEDILQKLLPEFADSRLAAVFPSYVNRKAGTLEALNWRLERLLKSLENYAGGPVTSHGATVAYRANLLGKVFEKLSDHPWFNDDVVLPLITRAQNPQLKTKYLVNTASYDCGSTIDSKKEFSRRQRISYGNVEWIRELCGYVLCHNGIAFGISLRRFFRLLWVYWGGLFALSGIGSFVSHLLRSCLGENQVFFCFPMQIPVWLFALALIFLVSCIVLKSAAFRGVLEAAVASLLVPYYVFTKRRVKW